MTTSSSSRHCERAPHCDACVADWVAIHRGNVEVIGRQWADLAIAQLTRAGRERKPWPAYDDSELVRNLALKRVRHLAGPDVRIREALARVCCCAAATHYAARIAASDVAAG